VNALYIIGEPGAGKSTLVEAMTHGLKPAELDVPFACRWYRGMDLLELGKRRKDFSGTDALPMNVQPVVEQFLAEHDNQPAFLLGEGDRLGNSKFFSFLRQIGYDLRIIYLDAGGEALKRRIERGSSQNEAWLRGRATKVKRLAMTEPGVQFIDATGSIDLIVGALADPVSNALWAERFLTP
jgi:adenylate kinase family enzyme